MLALAVLLLGSGCTTDPTDETAQAASPSPSSTPTPTPRPPTPSPTPRPSPAPSPTPRPSPAPEPSPEASELAALTDDELAALAVNELGRVLIGEWHVIGDTDGEYRTSRATFRRQLGTLYERGYRPVTQAEFLAGTFPIPAGTSPVVLTFDDSTRDQFALDDAGEPVPETAVGIIEAFAAEHEDWRATAVFAFNFPQPFGDADVEPKLRWLTENGYEFSNHTVGHANLSSLGREAIEANLAENQALLLEVVPDADVPSLTLPFGARANDRGVELTGSHDGTTYEHGLVYMVGAYPARSPHDVAFDPLEVQRVPAHAVAGTGPEWFWDRLDDLDAPGTRFVSDGDPTTVTVPAALADEVAAVDDLRVRTYP